MNKKEIIGICEFLKIHHFENAYNLLDYIEEMKQENKQLKKQKDDVVEYIKHKMSIKENYMIYGDIGTEILRMLGEIDDNKRNDE